MIDPRLSRYNRALWKLIQDQPFYGTLAANLRPEFPPTVDTALTDGVAVRFNPGFFDGLTDGQVRYAIAHETLHCAHGHLWRCEGRNPETWNIAADMAVNGILSQIKGLEAIPGGVVAPAAWADWPEERIYAQLPPPKGGDGGGSGYKDPMGYQQPPDGQQQQETGQSPAPASQDIQEKWQRAVAQAAQVAQAGQGTLPADLERQLEESRRIRVDWRSELADFIRRTASERADWSRASRRMAWQSVIYPRRRRDQANPLIVVRDTSGSIDGALLGEFTELAAGAIREIGGAGLLLDVDADVNQIQEISSGNVPAGKAKGGGGTDFRPAFDWVAKQIEAGREFSGLVYLTDGEGTFPKEAPEYPVLWVVVGSAKVPWGRNVRVER